MGDKTGTPERSWDVDVSLMFGLSYANYFVAPRSVLEMMPREWQLEFTALVTQLDRAIDGALDGNYEVHLLQRERRLIFECEMCPDCDGEGAITRRRWWLLNVKLVECATCDGLGELEGPVDHRYETGEEVGFKTDPRADYRRPHHGLRFDALAYDDARRETRRG